MEYQLADLFESIADHVPDREALVIHDDVRGDGEVRLTYRGLDERANQVGHHLAAVGIGRGDHVGCHMPNGAAYLETVIGCFKIGAVPVNVNYRYVEEELRYLYNDAQIKALVFDAEFADRVSAVVPEVETLEHLLVVGDPTGATIPAQTERFEEVTFATSTERGFEPRSPDDIWLLYTGGTTGMPKGVMWRHEDIFFAGMGGGTPVGEPVQSPEELHQRVDASPDAFQMTMLVAPPLMHGAAQLGSFIGFWAGSRIVMLRKYEGHRALEVIEREKVNTISLVGDAMALPLIDALEEKEYDTSSVFVMSTAGAIMSRSVRERVSELMPTVHVLDSFGSSETGYSGSEAEGSSPDEGLKFKMTERTAVISDDRRVLAPGDDATGRVAQRGHIPLGYYNDPEKTAESFVEIDGERWVITGDEAWVDEEGVIHVLGRGTVCINSGGEKVFPEEVEAALKSHPAIVDAVVAGIPDERFGERVGAVITLKAGADSLSQKQIEEHLSDRIARYKFPRVVHEAEEIVRSPSGKCDYRWARSTLAEAAGVSA